MRLSVRAADGWDCVCGNADRDERAGFPYAGFAPCTTQGERGVPCSRRWRSGLWVCKRCGRIIYATEQKAEVVGFAFDNHLSEWERYEILTARAHLLAAPVGKR